MQLADNAKKRAGSQWLQMWDVDQCNKVKWSCATRIPWVVYCHKTSGNMRVAQLLLGLLNKQTFSVKQNPWHGRQVDCTPIFSTLVTEENKLVTLIHVTSSCTKLAACLRPGLAKMLGFYAAINTIIKMSNDMIWWAGEGVYWRHAHTYPFQLERPSLIPHVLKSFPALS
jgi:hypothetical protein